MTTNHSDQQTPLTIYTIGHSNVPTSKIIELITKYEIKVLVDVRSSPYSRYVPQFNREMFQAVIQREGLDYKFAGEYLGGRPKDPTCYKNGQIPDGHADFLQLVDYPAVMTKEWYQKGIQRLLEIAQEKTTAIMCSEEDPGRCHRQHLISQTLLKQGIEVFHIRSDSRLQKAWLLVEKKEEKPENKPAEQMTLLEMAKTDPPEKSDQADPELLYEPVDEKMMFAFPDFLTDKGSSAQQKQTNNKEKKPSSKKQVQREQEEKERLSRWIEKNKGN
jgi:hypothetical protein